MIRQEHAAAFLGLMGTFADGAPVYDGQVPVKPDGSRVEVPYRLVHFQFTTPGADDRPNLIDIEDANRPLEMRAFVHSVAETARAARAVADQTYAVVVDQELVVTGRTSFLIRHEDSQPPARDESTGETLFAAVDVYRTLSVPA